LLARLRPSRILGMDTETLPVLYEPDAREPAAGETQIAPAPCRKLSSRGWGLPVRERAAPYLTARGPDHRVYVRDEHGELRELTEDEMLERVEHYLARRFNTGAPFILQTEDAKTFLRTHMAPRDRVVFSVLFLDRKRRLIAFTDLFVGTVNGVAIHPREVLRETLTRNAVSVVFARNDPSGCTEITHADKLHLRRLEKALAIFEIAVHDYLIVGENITSMAEEGLL